MVANAKRELHCQQERNVRTYSMIGLLGKPYKCGIEGHHLQDISGGGDGDSSSTALPPRVAPALCHPATTACIHMMRYKIQTQETP